MKLHIPHPIRDAHQRREEQDARLREAVRRSGLRNRCPQTYEAFGQDGRLS